MWFKSKNAKCFWDLLDIQHFYDKLTFGISIYITEQGTSWSWSYGSWIYNNICNQCLSPLTLWVRISLRRGVLNTTLCNKVCQWLAAGRWFSPVTSVSSTNKTDHHKPTYYRVCWNCTIVINSIWSTSWSWGYTI